jgi:plasmid stabilization system protein ParE
MAIGMNYRISVRSQAETDIAAAAVWYDQQSLGLGTEFLRAVEVSIATIARNPAIFAVVHKSVRRLLLRRFPYGLYYVMTSDSIVIIACLHGRQSHDRLVSRSP